MRLLVISNNPDRASFRQRVGIYLDTLSHSGIKCRVAKLPKGTLPRLKLFIEASHQDGVFLHKKGLNFLDAFFLRRYNKKIIYDFDDAMMYSPKSPDTDSLSHFLPFRRTAMLADMIIAGNPYLAEHALRFNNNVKTLPTGLDTETYRVKDIPKKSGEIRLVWIGSKSTLPYLAEIKPALEEIGTIFSNVILRIICDDFFDLQHMKVEKCQWAKATEARDLATSDIGLAPLPDNRFTKGKCGFKILQYAAAGLPSVASPVGINSEYVRDSVTGFLAKDPSQWIKNLRKLIENPELRKKAGQAARSEVKNLDIKIIERKLAQYINGLFV